MKIKRLSALIMALAMLTVGGVYAAWTFAGNPATQAEATIAPVIETASSGSGRGKYEIEISFAGTGLYVIDQESASSHKAVIKVEDTAKITIRFTPNESASDEIKENGLKTQLQFSFGDVVNYTMDDEGNYAASDVATKTINVFQIDPRNGNPEKIYSILPVGSAVSDAAVEKLWEKDTTPGKEGQFIHVINATSLKGILQFSQDFVVDTFAEYEQFGKCVTGTKLKLSVTDPN